MKAEAVIFDIDGTLWDTVNLVVTAWNRALAEFGLRKENALTREEMLGEFGKPADVIMEDLFPELEAEIREKLYKKCSSYEEDLIAGWQENILYPGVREVLEALSKKCKVGVVSNCQTNYMHIFIQKNHLENYVADALCYGDTFLSKGENIRLLMERNDITHAFYVGDTVSDYQAAEAADVPFIYVKYGFGEQTGRVVKSPYRVIESLWELTQII